MCVKHRVQPSDTLQGIALKYGVTTQDIRHVNKLFPNDNICLRETILIPLRSDTSESDGTFTNAPLTSASTEESSTDPLRQPCTVDFVDETLVVSSSTSVSTHTQSSNSNSAVDKRTSNGGTGSSSSNVITKSKSEYSSLRDSTTDGTTRATVVA
jgi:spore germination protein YaaH